MRTVWFLPALWLAGCTGLGAVAPNYAVGTYRGAVIGSGSCNSPAVDLTVSISKWSAYGDWYVEQQNLRAQFLGGWVYDAGFLASRRVPQGGLDYVGGNFVSGGSSMDVRIDTGACTYSGSIART